MSALKIPGFSTSLHPFDADLYVVAPSGVDIYRTDSLTRIASHHFPDR
ncbi:beta-propeller domain-containing protein [Tessaracoccus antarcticus]|nr:beta-propeller domain-containing protein [Tessaracoccus antarcticus]